jgi:hypothetical protein
MYVCTIRLARTQEHLDCKHWCKVTVVGLRKEATEDGMRIQFKSTDTL